MLTLVVLLVILPAVPIHAGNTVYAYPCVVYDKKRPSSFTNSHQLPISCTSTHKIGLMMYNYAGIKVSIMQKHQAYCKHNGKVYLIKILLKVGRMVSLMATTNPINKGRMAGSSSQVTPSSLTS